MKKNNRIMAFGLLIAFGLSCMLIGCGAKVSRVKQIETTASEDTIAWLFDGNANILEFDMQEDIQGVVLSKELWEKGKLIEQWGFLYGGNMDGEKLYIGSEKTTLDDERKKVEWNAISVNKEGNASSHIPLGNYVLDKFSSSSSAFIDLTVEPNNSYVLYFEHFDYDVTSGRIVGASRSYEETLPTLQSEENAVIMLIRMDTYATEQEALNRMDEIKLKPEAEQ